MSRLSALLVVVAAIAAAVAVWTKEPALTLAGPGAAALTLLLAVPLALAATRRFLLVCAALAWCAAQYVSPAAPASLFTLGLAVGAATPAAVALALLPSRRAAALLAFATVGLLGVLSAVLFDPAASGCAECPRNLLLITDGPWEAVQRAGLVVGLAAIAWLGVTTRRTAVLPYLLVVAAQYAHSLPRGYIGDDQRLWALQGVTLLLVCAALAWAPIRVRRARARVAQLVVALEARPELRGLRDVLVDMLGDPSLQLAYLVGNRRLDVQGRAVTPQAHVTRLGDDAELHSARRHFDEAAPAIAAAARLTLRNERLHAELRARLEELRAVRGRIVATADGERRRLERDLHDGAQQRLATLAISLESARRRAQGAEAEALAQAQLDLRAALRELREVAHGLVPAVLADEGLGAAIEAFAETAEVELRHPLPADRYPSAIETTAYQFITETVRRAGRGTVQIMRDPQRLVLAVHTPAAPHELIDLDDRVGALGGSLRVDGTSIIAELPCA